MGSSKGQDQCLGGGLSLPQWIKGRGDTRYDFDHGSFSPPSHDDNFLCIKYSAKPSKVAINDNSEKLNRERASNYGLPIGQLLNENSKNGGLVAQSTVASSSMSQLSNTTSIKDTTKSIDFSKHPLPCQPFVPTPGGGGKITTTAIGTANGKKIFKPQGTDDGFHSEPALCGKSIVHVANRMMSGKLAKVDAGTEMKNGSGDVTYGQSSSSTTFNAEQQFVRRGSKSLPVSPITSASSTPNASPKARRRVNGNRCVTDAAYPVDNKYQAGWLLSSILGRDSTISGANNKIQEEVDENEIAPHHHDELPSKYLSRKKSISSQNLLYFDNSNESKSDEAKKDATLYANVFKAKPSELREMNFWSPTSM